MILFVHNMSKEIVGSLTDGDVRRSLLQDKDVNKKVGLLCNRNFEYCYSDEDYLNFKKYRKKDIRILPILDRNKKLIDLIDLAIIRAKLPLECFIMAGGRGERLRPLTDSIPKPMLLLGNKPIIEHVVDKLVLFGIKKIYISIKYLGDQIVEFLGDGSRKGISIEYIREDQPLGTAGSLSLVKKFNTEHILLMNSDLFTDANFEDLYLMTIQNKASLGVATIPYTTKVPYGVFKTNEHTVVGLKEKPIYTNYANAGIYIISTDVLDRIPHNCFYNITDLIEQLISENKTIIHDPIISYWIDIGQHQDYLNAQEIVKHLQN
ncbi:MAG TPA: nucleotidyltransferase [Bacteroidales bacterium]|nr:nucleotidyltransferase [Bacteroidales bacterium]